MYNRPEAIAGFIVLGMGDFGACVKHYDGGALELMHEVVKYAPHLERMSQAGYEFTGEFPGVFEYDVAEEFGRLYAEELMTLDAETLPSTEFCAGLLVTLTKKFFLTGFDAGDRLDGKLRQFV